VLLTHWSEKLYFALVKWNLSSAICCWTDTRGNYIRFLYFSRNSWLFFKSVLTVNLFSQNYRKQLCFISYSRFITTPSSHSLQVLLMIIYLCWNHFGGNVVMLSSQIYQIRRFPLDCKLERVIFPEIFVIIGVESIFQSQITQFSTTNNFDAILNFSLHHLSHRLDRFHTYHNNSSFLVKQQASMSSSVDFWGWNHSHPYDFVTIPLTFSWTLDESQFILTLFNDRSRFSSWLQSILLSVPESVFWRRKNQGICILLIFNEHMHWLSDLMFSLIEWNLNSLANNIVMSSVINLLAWTIEEKIAPSCRSCLKSLETLSVKDMLLMQ